MPLRPHRHLRNRQPRPNQVTSPPTQVQIISARSVGGPTNQTLCIFNAPVQLFADTIITVHDYTQGDHSVAILCGSAQPTRFTVIWQTAQVRIGHTIGWDEVPANFTAMQIAINAHQRFIVTA